MLPFISLALAARRVDLGEDGSPRVTTLDWTIQKTGATFLPSRLI
jgi:hypothetical protein